MSNGVVWGWESSATPAESSGVNVGGTGVDSTVGDEQETKTDRRRGDAHNWTLGPGRRSRLRRRPPSGDGIA